MSIAPPDVKNLEDFEICVFYRHVGPKGLEKPVVREHLIPNGAWGGEPLPGP